MTHTKWLNVSKSQNIIVILAVFFFSQEEGVLNTFFELRCNQSVFFLIYIGLALSYKLILHVIALVLACQIRNVKVDVLNDSRETVAIIYASTFLLVLTCLILAVLSRSFEHTTIMWSILVFFVATIYIGITFIPKVCSAWLSRDKLYYNYS